MERNMQVFKSSITLALSREKSGVLQGKSDPTAYSCFEAGVNYGLGFYGLTYVDPLEGIKESEQHTTVMDLNAAKELAGNTNIGLQYFRDGLLLVAEKAANMGLSDDLIQQQLAALTLE